MDQPYLEHVEFHLVPDRGGFLIESHVPKPFRTAYHHHVSVEVNYLVDCEIEYSFSGRMVRVEPERMTVFWGANPHCVTGVIGQGRIINIYVALTQVLTLGLSNTFTETIMGGAVLAAPRSGLPDREIFGRWADDFARAGGDASWQQLLAGEIEMRLRRMALEDLNVLMPGVLGANIDVASSSAMRHAERMLVYIADNFTGPLTVADVASHLGLSPSYAMALFRRSVGVPIKAYITRTRINHARMLLSGSNRKIISVAMDSGFASLSSFYEAFRAHESRTPAAFRLELRR